MGNTGGRGCSCTGCRELPVRVPLWGDEFRSGSRTTIDEINALWWKCREQLEGMAPTRQLGLFCFELTSVYSTLTCPWGMPGGDVGFLQRPSKRNSSEAGMADLRKSTKM